MKATIITAITLTSLLATSALAETEAIEAAAKAEQPAKGAEGAGDISIMQGSGPFNTIQDVKNYDAATQGSQCIVTFVDGAQVQQLFGFGPCEITEYFRCSDNRYHFQCWEYASGATRWDGSLLSLASGPGTRLYIDGVLQHWNSGTWTETVDISTCTGDSSPYLSSPYKYYLVTFWQTRSGGTLISRTCP